MLFFLNSRYYTCVLFKTQPSAATERADKSNGIAGTGTLREKKAFPSCDVASNANQRKIDFVFNFDRRGNLFEFNSMYSLMIRSLRRHIRSLFSLIIIVTNAKLINRSADASQRYNMRILRVSHNFTRHRTLQERIVFEF